MSLMEHFQQAYINFTAAKLRSFLAILGILVGTVAVVALLSCGRLATDKALAEFKSLGTDLLAMNVYQAKPSQQQTHAPMRESTWEQLATQVPRIKKLAPYASTYQKITYLGRPLESILIGADERLADIIHIQLARGSFVSFVESVEHYCVLGDALAQQIQKMTLDDPLGKQIQIGVIIYTIIGIAAPWKENAFFNYDINRALMIPLSGMSLISGNTEINNAMVLLHADIPLDLVMTEIKETMARLAPEQETYIRSAKQMLVSMEKQGQIFTLLLSVIGSISLLVGGIGVMNVMLVSVSERKKEIGIRKAVGAKAHEIQMLFLMESVLLAVSGGVLGILLGEMLTWMIAYFSDWPFALYLMPPLAGFAVSAAAGILFGYYPAKRAAILEPMVSLRGD
jgi:putative ABC transport system permease protein